MFSRNVLRLLGDGIRCRLRRPPRRRALGVDVPPRRFPVDPQLPRHATNGQPPSLCLLYCPPPLPLEKSRLPWCGSNCYCRHVLVVNVRIIFFCPIHLCLRQPRHRSRCDSQALGIRGRDSNRGSGPWPFLSAPGLGWASWEAMMRPSCCSDSRPSRPCSTTTTAPA